ncbi:hypothetical protein CDL15_Pgr019418 [Punica granatum]|uniref:Uncharacterized protein n=1 Tax=Punica granatum TaxID=22663 RepID=A0A218XSC5_PUNGR|nr:hypothetical protein CDL15_Pgr019418 [Punica granatum]
MVKRDHDLSVRSSSELRLRGLDRLSVLMETLIVGDLGFWASSLLPKDFWKGVSTERLTSVTGGLFSEEEVMVFVNSRLGGKSNCLTLDCSGRQNGSLSSTLKLNTLRGNTIRWRTSYQGRNKH